MIKIIRTALCFLICVSLVALCGCNRQSTSTIGGADAPKLVYESTLSYSWLGIGNHNILIKNSLNIDKMDSDSIEHLPIFKFENKQELDDFKKNIFVSFTLDESHGGVPSFNAATRSFDEEHFKENTILLVGIPATSGSVRHYVDSIDIENGNLLVSVGVNTPNAVTMDLISWFILVSVNKEHLENVTSFDAVYLGG